MRCGWSGLATGAVLIMVVLTGCVSSSPPTEGEALDEILISDERFGAVVGTVLDSQLAPIAGAQVGLIDLQRTTTTDASGAFTFPDVPAGDHQLAAQRLGHESAIVRITVQPGETLSHTFHLEPVAIVEPYMTVPIQRGMFGCGFAYRPHVAGIVGASACGVFSIYLNLTSVDQFMLLWDLDGDYDQWHGAAYEMEWQSTQLLGRGLWLRFESVDCAGSEDSRWTSIRGASPLNDVQDDAALSMHKQNNTESSCGGADNCGPGECRLQSRVFPHTETLGSSAPADVGVTFQQPFTQYWSQFFNQEPPVGYTALPDA